MAIGAIIVVAILIRLMVVNYEDIKEMYKEFTNYKIQKY